MRLNQKAIIKARKAWVSEWSRSVVSDSLRPVDYSLPSSSSMGFSRQEYWRGLPFPSPGDLPNPGIEPRSPTLQADALTSAPPGNPLNTRIQVLTSKISRVEKKPGWKKKGEEAGGGAERGGLTDLDPICLCSSKSGLHGSITDMLRSLWEVRDLRPHSSRTLF